MPDARDPVFSRVQVDHLVRGGTRVWWSVSYLFHAPQPWSFALQWGSTDDPGADDWATVAGPATNVWTLTDPNRHLSGMRPSSYYRVVLTDASGAAYTSRPVGVLGLLDTRSWLEAREVARKEDLLLRGYAAVDGWLLKRRLSGPGQSPTQAADPRTMVVDPLTGGILKRQDSPATVGTPYLGGYYAPVPWKVQLQPGAWDAEVDAEGGGNADPDATILAGNRAVLFPLPARRDVFVAEGSDFRYEIHKVTVLAAFRGVPIVGAVDLRRLPFGDIIYDLDLDTMTVTSDGEAG